MSVTVRFAGEANSLLQEQDKISAGAQKVTDEYKEWLKGVKELDAAHKRFTVDSTSAFDKHANKLRDLDKLWGSGRISAEQYHVAVKRANEEFSSVADKGQSHFLSMIKNAALAASAVGLVREAWSAVLDIQQQSAEIDRARAEKSQRMASGAASFVAMQPKESAKSRLDQVLQWTQGAMEPGLALDMFQGLQSATPGGTTDEGFQRTGKAFREVITSAFIGLPGELANELAIQGINAGVAPEAMIRGAFAAGQASSRSAKEVAQAAPAIPGFGDVGFGAAVAAMQATMDPREVKSLTFAAQKALSGSSGALAWFGERGLPGNATPSQRLKELQAAGIDTPDELRGIGITEDLQVRAMAGILGKNFKTLEDVQSQVVSAMNDPGFLKNIQNTAEAAVPTMRQARQVSQQEGKMEAWQGFDQAGLARKEAELTTFNELKKRGMEKGPFGFNYFNESGELIHPWIFYLTQTAEQQRVAMQSYVMSGSVVAEQVEKQIAEQKRKTPAIQKQEK